jgi:hypothetical protein
MRAITILNEGLCVHRAAIRYPEFSWGFSFQISRWMYYIQQLYLNFPGMYGMFQKSPNPKSEGKYFVSVIEKFQFSVPSGNTGLLSFQQVDGLTLCIRCSLVNCLCNKHHAVFNNAACV